MKNEEKLEIGGKTVPPVKTHPNTGDESSLPAAPCSLLEYVTERRKELEIEYEAKEGERQWQSIIAGQLLELSEIQKTFLANSKSTNAEGNGE